MQNRTVLWAATVGLCSVATAVGFGCSFGSAGTEEVTRSVSPHAEKTPKPVELNQRLVEALDDWNVAEAVALVEQGAQPNVRSRRGETALMLASNIEGTGFVESLLARGADVNVKTPDGWTALFQAANCGNTAVVKLLIERGADVNAKLNDGSTPLIKAAANGYEEPVRVLRAHGADVSTRTKNGKDALAWAREAGHPDGVRLLKKAKE